MRVLKISLVLCVVVVSLAAPGVAAAAAGVLDQTSTDTSNSFAGFVSQLHGAVATQTFTAGVSGQLTDVQLPVWEEIQVAASQLQATINPAPGGVVNAGVTLATATVSSSAVPQVPTVTWLDFAFGTPPQLTAGSQYAIVLTELGGVHEHFYWVGASSDVYAGGSSSDTLFATSGADFAFATYMASNASSGGGSRIAYCAAVGDTSPDGTAIEAGTFLDLRAGQPDNDPRYSGATPALFVEGEGLTCDAPPGFTANGETVGYDGAGSTGPYPYYERSS